MTIKISACLYRHFTVRICRNNKSRQLSPLNEEICCEQNGYTHTSLPASFLWPYPLHPETISANLSTLIQDEVLNTLIPCGGNGWVRVAYLTMSDPSQSCPFAWRLFTGPQRGCGKQNGVHMSSGLSCVCQMGDKYNEELYLQFLLSEDLHIWLHFLHRYHHHATKELLQGQLDVVC